MSRSHYAGLLKLAQDWRNGAVILAGTGVADRVYPHARLSRDCSYPRCCTTVFGDTDAETADRLANHRQRCHSR